MKKEKVLKAIQEVVKESTYDLLLPNGKLSFMRNIRFKINKLYKDGK